MDKIFNNVSGIERIAEFNRINLTYFKFDSTYKLLLG